jgi:hypothetical protein
MIKINSTVKFTRELFPRLEWTFNGDISSVDLDILFNRTRKEFRKVQI